jgi:hypothetical protein
MRAACLISGKPRFCKSFDIQLESLKNFDTVDWYITLWKNQDNSTEWKDYSSKWQNIDTDISRSLIEERLPFNHTLRHIDVRDQNQCPQNPHKVQGFYYDSDKLWMQYTILKWCDQARQSYEKIYGEYDIVIRTRPDTLIIGEIDLKYWEEVLKQNQKQVILPYPDRSGSKGFNDRFSMCSSNGMTDYTNAMDSWMLVHQQGVPWNPEELLGSVMMSKGYVWPPTNFNSMIRGHQYGNFDDSGHWRPDFGTWA